MNLYPTRPAAHVAIAGLAVVGVGVVTQQAAIVGWGGAMLVAVAIARAVTLISVARIRAAGFEMLWVGSKRMVRTGRGGVVELEAEVRNRDTLAARYVKLRALSSPNVEVSIEPPEGEVTACGRLHVKVKVRTPRVGQHGVHGLALEVHGAPGMFEVPLTFANPYGIEVLPRPFAAYLMQPRGGRSHLIAPAGRPGRARGDGSELRELREHLPGDPFRRIAWKASARRGKLMVREFEREERDVLWIVLDASVELWSGPPGRAPLDLAIDEAAALATRHLSRGDRVGLAIVASTRRTFIPPDAGPGHGAKIAHALIVGSGTYDAERSDLDELDVAVRVLEHLRPLDSKGLADVRRGDLDKLAIRADAMRSKAPFSARAPEARTLRDRTLRRYLACYGIESPPRTEPERKATAETLPKVLSKIAQTKPRPSIVHILAAPPEMGQQKPLVDAVRRLTRTRSLVTWSSPQFEPGLRPPWPSPAAPKSDDEPMPKPAFDEIAPDAAAAVRIRSRVAQLQAEDGLRRLGVRVVRLRARPTTRTSQGTVAADLEAPAPVEVTMRASTRPPAPSASP